LAKAYGTILGVHQPIRQPRIITNRKDKKNNAKLQWTGHSVPQGF
jgi:hypothetical protein